MVVPPDQPTDFDTRLLRGLIGTKVTTYDDFPDGASSDSAAPATPSSLVPPLKALSLTTPLGIARTWVITKKLGEKATYLTEQDVQMGVGYPKTVGKYLCHLDGDPTQIAVMRIYQQIPIEGTEDADINTLAQQAVPPPVLGELESFKLLKSHGCRSVPRFLGHAERTQGEHELLPGGYVVYVAWEAVTGEPLTKEYFWSLDRSAREEIRSKFRAAYEEVISCGTAPGALSSISKIIYDQSTGKLYAEESLLIR